MTIIRIVLLQRNALEVWIVDTLNLSLQVAISRNNYCVCTLTVGAKIIVRLSRTSQ